MSMRRPGVKLPDGTHSWGAEPRRKPLLPGTESTPVAERSDGIVNAFVPGAALPGVPDNSWRRYAPWGALAPV